MALPLNARLAGPRRDVSPSRLQFARGSAKALMWTTLVVGALVFLFPFIWMLATSVKPEAQAITYPPTLFPRSVDLSPYVNVWGNIDLVQLYVNTLIFAGSVTVLSVTLNSLAAYAFARLRFPGKELLFWVVLVTLMVPIAVLIVPLFFEVYKFHWLNTYQGLIVPLAANGYGIFLLRQFFSTLPFELDDAARVDGAGEFFIYLRIVVRLSGPAIAALAIFTFSFNWNNFLWPLIITTTANMRTLPSGLVLFTGQHEVIYNLMSAAAALAMAPLVVLFFFLQRYFVRGIALSGLK
jgi:multiple sugar transport system permease protein